MSEPFLGEIHIFGFNFAPRSYALCDGQLLPINQNQALFSLLGTTYGGDGRTTFALPDLRGRVPMHTNSVHRQGERTGSEGVFLTAFHIPSHSHPANATSDNAALSSPAGNLPAPVVPGFNAYGGATNLAPGHDGEIGNAGGGQAHDNMQPFLTINFCIALQGLFPSRN